MSLREKIKPYIDGNGLVAPSIVPQGRLQGSDNGPMFTSEYYIMLKRQGDFTTVDEAAYLLKIRQCLTFLVGGGALLNRAPVDHSQDSIDDYLAICAGSKELGEVLIPRMFLKALWEGRGWLNNNLPGVKTQESFMLRFPQLIAAMIAAAYPDKTLKHRVIRLLAFPLFAYAALTTLVAAVFAPKTRLADPWRLSWLLIQAVSPVSLLTRLAAKYWKYRLAQAFPDNAPDHMRGVACLYYEAGHPFRYYWVD